MLSQLPFPGSTSANSFSQCLFAERSDEMQFSGRD